jgi:hypothetical protein
MWVVKPPVTISPSFGMRGCRVGTAMLALAALALAPAAHGYVPPLDNMLEEVGVGAPSANSAIIELQCNVFAPAGAPSADPQRGFRQRIYWQRGKVLAVETLAGDGTLLHVLVREGGFTDAAQISPVRRFSETDVRPQLFPFLEGGTVAWRDELAYWGVSPAKVELVLTKSGQAYRLTDGSDKALWLEKEGGRPLRLVTRIEGGTAPQVLSIEFSDFISFATKGPEKDYPRIPRTITYTLDGKVFKEARIAAFEADPPAHKFSLARLRQLAAAGKGGAGSR